MNYHADIQVKVTKPALMKSLTPEFKEGRHDRSSVRIAKTKGGIKLSVSAKDSTALRASLNTITQLLSVYEKAGKLK